MLTLTLKILAQLVMPLSSALLLLAVGLGALLRRRRRTGFGLILAGLAWLWLWSTPMVAGRLAFSLESLYPPVPVESLPAADAAVVLGGAISGAAPPRFYPDLGSAADRIWHGARLYHAGKAPLLILSGGVVPWQRIKGAESEAMVEFLRDLGVPRDKLLMEVRSETTRENALETGQLLSARGIQRVLLVTSALHMRRAEATFRAAGVDVIPAATDHEMVFGGERTLLDFLPDAGALAWSSRALWELLGLWFYRSRGWADG